MTEKTLLEYWYVLYSRKWIIIFIMLSAMITAWILSEILPPVYEAKAVFFVPKEPDTATFFSTPGGSMIKSPLSPLPIEEPHGPYIGILKSKAIAELVQKEFPQKNVGNLMGKDMAFVLSDEFMIQVYARDRDPQIAANIANAYVKYFNQLMSGYSLPIQSQTRVTIEKEISDNQKRLSGAMEALKDFQEKNRTVNMDEETKQLVLQKTTFETQLETAKIDYDSNNERILATEKELKNELDILKTPEIVVSSPLLEKLKAQLVDIKVKMSTLKMELQESHPDFVALKNSYEEVEKNIASEVESITNSQIKGTDTFYEGLRRQLISLYIDRERIKAGIEAMQKVLKRIDERIFEIPRVKKEMDTLAIEVERYKKLRETLKINLEEISAQTERTLQVAVLVDEATPPIKPSFPVLWLNVLVAGMAGFISGVFYCFFVSYLEETREKRIYKLLKAIDASEG